MASVIYSLSLYITDPQHASAEGEPLQFPLTNAQLKEQLDAMMVERDYWIDKLEEVTADRNVLLAAVQDVRDAVKGLSDRNRQRPPEKQAKRLALARGGMHTG